MLIFKPFNNEEQLRLAKVQIKNKVKFLEKKYGWTIKIGDDLYEYVSSKSKNDLYGARPMERLIEYILNYSIAEYQIEYGRLEESSVIRIDLVNAEYNLIRMRANSRSVDVRIDTDFNTGAFREELVLNLA